MCPIALYNHAKNWADPYSCFGGRVKNLEKRTLNPPQSRINFFQKRHLAQMMRPIILYNHAKNWEDHYSLLKEKVINLKKLYSPIILD